MPTAKITGLSAGTYTTITAVAADQAITAEGTGDNVFFIVDDSNANNLVFTLSGGDVTGTFDTNYSLATPGPITAAAFAAGPVCVQKIAVTGLTSDEGVLVGTPSVWVYGGDVDLGDPTFQQKLDGVDILGGVGLSFPITLTEHSAKVFSIVETFLDQSITSNEVTIDTFTGSFTASDTGAIWWHDPENVVTSGGLLTNWPNSATNGSNIWDLDTIPPNTTAPIWNAVEKKAVNDGTRILTTGSTSNIILDREDYLNPGEGRILYLVAKVLPNANGTSDFYSLSESSGTSQSRRFYFDKQSFEGRLEIGTTGRRFSTVYDIKSLVTTGNTPTGKLLLENHFTANTVEFFINGVSVGTGANGPSTINARSLSLFGRATATASSPQPPTVEIYEDFLTSTLANNVSVRAELAARHNITLGA